MILLASFPRSGNTFFRNVLYEVYGIESSTFHLDPDRVLDEGYVNYPVIKTHELPHNLPDSIRDRPAVYIIRDARDALVSIAHHRKDIVAPGSDFYTNLLEAIIAEKGSFFGGWSENVRQWTDKAAIVIRFQDLIEDPIREIEKLRSIMELPAPQYDKLPSFKQLKFGSPKYGAGKRKKIKKLQEKHFRRGKVGGWKDELPIELGKLLWTMHGKELQRNAYKAPPPEYLPYQGPARKVFIEGSKLFSVDNDGVKRYVTELATAMSMLVKYIPGWEIYLQGQLLTSSSRKSNFTQTTEKERIISDQNTMWYEKLLLLFKLMIKRVLPSKWYMGIRDFYVNGPFRRWLSIWRDKVFVLQKRFYRSRAEGVIKSADLVHHTLPQHVDKFQTAPASLLVTVHDLTHQTHPEFHTAPNIAAAEKGLQQAIEADAHFLAVSESTKTDMINHYQVDENQVTRIYEAANMTKFHFVDKGKKKLLKKYGLSPDQPFLLCLSTIEPRKNLQNTIRAFLQLKEKQPALDAKLLICGKYGWKTDDVFAGVNLDHPDIVFTGFLDDRLLSTLYSSARALCYLSFYEGFGLPILEAMACRTPVIYADNSSLPEVAAEGGLPVKADDLDAIQQAMYQILTDDELYAELSQKAWLQTNKFSWLKTAMQTLELYDQIIAEKRSA